MSDQPEELNWWQKHALWFKDLGKFHTFEGSLLRLGREFCKVRPARAYAWHHKNIRTGRDLRACLRAGPHVWPGAYDIRFITEDGDCVCPWCVIKDYERCIQDIRDKQSDRIVALEASCNLDPSPAWACRDCGENMWDQEEIDELEQKQQS